MKKHFPFIFALIFVLSLITFMFALPTGSFAQSQRNPCFTTSITNNTPNCIPVGTFKSTGAWGPLPVGGVANASAPTFIEGLPAGLSFDLIGNLRVVTSGGGTVTGNVSNATSGVATSSTNVGTVAYNYAFNGTTWDQVKSKAASTAAVATDTSIVTQLNPLSPGIVTLGQATKANSVPMVIASDQFGPAAVSNSLPFTLSSQYPTNATTTAPTAVTATATGTTAATAASLGATASVTNFVCGFTITADATALATGTATLSGTISGSLNYLQTIVAVTSGASVLTQNFNPCIPASAVNTAITITSAAAGTGGNTIVNIWGYRL